MKTNDNLFAFCSGLLTVFAVGYIHFLLAWICFVPFFIVLKHATVRKAVQLAIFFALGISVIAFYWMIPGSQRFTGSSIIYGFIAALLSTIVLAAYWALLTAVFVYLRVNTGKKYTAIQNAVLIACICVVFEYFISSFTAGFPWLAFTTSYTLSANLLAIQPVSIFGIYIITFIVILVNYLLAGIFISQQWKNLFWPAAIVVIYLSSGYFILRYYNGHLPPAQPFSVAILADNIAPEEKWDEQNGNRLVNVILQQNQKAVALKPAIALWSESAIPWTYRADDDLVKEVLKTTAPANITHVMGINTDYAGNVVYNSVYCILPNGQVAGRYDKRFLLNLIEKPFNSFIIPFYSSAGYTVKSGTNNTPLNTPFGKAGIMICNESAVPEAALKMTKNGAQFLFNLSNDGWFNNTYIVKQHFYNARLRGVETRKDIVVNSNYGLSGLIQSSGETEVIGQSDEPVVEKVFVAPNNYLPLAVRAPWLLVSLSIAYIFLLLGTKLPIFHLHKQIQ